MFPLANQAFEFVTPPRAYGPTGPVGQVVAATVSPVAGYLNLQALTFGIPYTATSGTQAVAGVVSFNYVTIEADGADLYVVFGATAASVSAGAKPVATAVGSISATGTYQGATGTAFKIPSGTQLRVLPQSTQDLYMGYVAGATGTMRLYQSSPAYNTR